MNEQAYVYKWTHIPTMKWYIGSRTANGCHINDGYITSSKIVLEMYKSNPSAWKREIISVGSPSSMRELEFEILELADAKNDLKSFNCHNGDGKFTTAGKTVSTETRLKQSISHTGKHVGEKNNFYGKKHSLKSIEKSKRIGIQNGMYGRVGSNHPKFGTQLSDETKELIRISKAGDRHWSKNPKFKWTCTHCGKTGTVTTNYNRWHGDRCKFKGIVNESS